MRQFFSWHSIPVLVFSELEPCWQAQISWHCQRFLKFLKAKAVPIGTRAHTRAVTRARCGLRRQVVLRSDLSWLRWLLYEIPGEHFKHVSFKWYCTVGGAIITPS